MRALILGGTGFLGLPIAHRLLASGHDVTTFHRGTSAVNLPKSVGIVLGDRNHLWDDYDKILVERVVSSDGDLQATVLRLPMVYGPGAREAVKRRFYAYLKRFDDGRPAILLDERTAKWRAPWGYTGDVAEAVRLVVENERTVGEIYNVGESHGLDIQSRIRNWQLSLDGLDEWSSWMSPCPPPNISRQLNLRQYLDMDTTKIRHDLGYHETMSRREALEKTVVWDREHPPNDADPAQFDYVAEDAILSRASR